MFYINDKEISYSSYVEEYDWYIVASRDIKDIQKGIEDSKLNAELIRHENSKINFYLLGFSWVISLILSIYLSIIINRLLKSYELQINQSNEKLIFQSRQALIGELFSMIAHQWRQPVNKIASVLALLRFDIREKRVDYEHIDAKCEEIENSVEFMSETIDDFRTFYRPKSSSEKVNLRLLIEQSLLFLDSTIEKNSIKVTKELDEIEYELYQNEFVQVMLNLIKNAIDAIQRDCVIDISLYKEESEVVIVVSNSAETISDEIIEKFFNPYFTTKEDSMGLGLYMAKIIIEKHMKGSIRAKSTNNKTEVMIRLP